MRNLIIGISVLFVAIIAVSYFYFSNLSETDGASPATNTPEETETEQLEPETSNGLIWTFDLNGGAITSPSVWMYDDNSHFILVQDAYHILHAISPDGQKLWNAQLPGPIVDSIGQLPDHSLVFTTAERLYRIDTEGDPLPGFSLKLPQRAAGGAIATSQPADDGTTVRIEVTGSRQVLSYDGRGKLLEQQARSIQASDEAHQTEHTTLSNLPADCGPHAYIGPLHGDGQRYLLCDKNDQKLHCIRY